jgi:hypothetical protein
MVAGLVQKIEVGLFRRGFVLPEARRLVRNQILLSAGCTAVACLVTGFTNPGLSFAAGAFIMTVNFWWLVKAAQELVRVRQGAVFTLLTLFYGRLALTAVAIAGLVAWGGASVYGLLAGLSTALLNAALWGVLQIRHKVPTVGKGKEA